MALASYAYSATNVMFYGAASEADAYNWSSTENGQPWVGGVAPVTGSPWDGITFDGVTGGGNEGFIKIDSNRMKVETINIGYGGENKTINFVFTKVDTQAFFNGLNNNGCGGKYKFYTINDTTTKLSSNNATSITLDTPVGQGAFSIEIGNGVNFTTGNEVAINNNTVAGGTRGSIILSKGGKFTAGNRLNFNKNGYLYEPSVSGGRDIIVNKGAEFIGKTVGFYNGVAMTVDGSFSMTAAIVNNVVLFDLGEEGTISFGDVTLGTSADIRIFDFRNEAVSVGNISGGKELAAFSRWDGTAWVNDLSVVNGFLYSSAIVPEPAEWAAIFGAIALGLAMYRRRK